MNYQLDTMKLNFIIATILTLSCAPLLAQDSTVDSLKTELDKASSDTSRITLLIELTYESSDSEERLKYAERAYSLGRNVESIRHKCRSEIIYGTYLAEQSLDEGIQLIENGAQRYLSNEMMSHAANAYFIQGITYEIEGTLDSAITSYVKTHKIASANEVHPEWGNAAFALANIHNTRGKNVEALRWALESKKAFEIAGRNQELGQTLNQIGIIYDQKGLYSEALDNYLKARELAIQADDVDGEILINNNIGVIYDNMNNSEMAMQYYSDALEKSRIHNLQANEATLLNNLSYIHARNGDTLKAVQLLKKSLEIDLQDIYPCFESYPLEGMGSIYVAQDKLDSAKYYLDRALATSLKCEDVVVQSTVYKDLGQLYAAQNNPSKALQSLEKALEIGLEANLRLETKEALQELYKFHKKKGNTLKAMQYLEQYQVMVDSIYNENNIEKATQLAAEYEFRKQVAEMEKEREEAELKLSKEIDAKTNENRLILLVLALLALFALTMIRGYFLIQRNNKRLQFLNDEKNKLIGIVAHDLRNPLNMIMGLMPLLSDSASEIKDDNLNKYIELLDASTVKMTNMIDRVLDISAIENMKVNLKVDKIDLNELTSKSINNFDIIAGQKAIKIVNDVDREDSHISKVDPNYLEQVIDNLLSNAIKFSDKGKRIHVSLKSENDKNVIVVRDEGPGIPMEEQDKLFRAFTTLSSKPTNQERSTGLGLSIAFKFIKAMQGEILCESKIGEGTSFKLVFDKA